MPTEILATASTAANSADVVVSAGTPLTVCLKDAAGPDVTQYAAVDILLKGDNGEYFKVDSLSAKDKPALMIVAPGTYRFSRIAGVSCGVFSG